MKEVKGFKCDFCGKIYQRKHLCQRHELTCKRNPINFRACFGCRFCEEQYRYIHFDNSQIGEVMEKRRVLFCSKKQIYVYPPKVERNIYGGGYELDDNYPMPKECDLRVDIYDINI